MSVQLLGNHTENFMPDACILLVLKWEPGQGIDTRYLSGRLKLYFVVVMITGVGTHTEGKLLDAQVWQSLVQRSL